MLENCVKSVILRFLQFPLDSGLSASVIRVYMAAISATARHIRVDNATVGSHSLVSNFLKGAATASAGQICTHMGSGHSVDEAMPTSI